MEKISTSDDVDYQEEQDQQQKVYLSEEEQRQIEESIRKRQELVTKICEKSHRKLDFGAQQLEDLDAIQIALYMSENPQKNYQLVHIGSNLITGKGLSAICKGLVHSTELEELYVGNNPYEGDDSLMELIDILPSFTKLRILNLNNCALGDDELSYLSFMIDQNYFPKLHTLSIGTNRFTEKGFFDLARVLPKLSSSLNCLHIGGNSLEKQTIDLFFMNLAKNKTLRTLYLNDTDLTESNLRLLDYALRSNNTLTELNLSNCGIDDNGLKCFLPGLMKNSTLQVLHLFNNPITEDCAFYILGTLEQFNETLFTITLYGTNIDQEGQLLQDIKDILTKNQNKITRINQEERNQKLKNIFVEDNELNSTDEQSKQNTEQEQIQDIQQTMENLDIKNFSENK